MNSDQDFFSSDYINFDLDIDDNYIRQNLPVRRQSLISFCNSINSQEEFHSDVNDEASPKRLYSLNFLSNLSIQEQQNLNTETNNGRLYNSKSLNAISKPNKNKVPNPPLSILITRPEDQSYSTTDSPFELSMDTLYEEVCTSPTEMEYQHKHHKSKFIGLLRTSKSDTCSIYNKKLDKSQLLNEDSPPQVTPTSSTSQTWTDITQPLSRLKNVFSRLQSNPTQTSRNKSVNKSCQIQQTEIKRKKRSSMILLDSKKKRTTEVIYGALLSHVSKEFLKIIQVTVTALKDGIEYHDVFTGAEAVSCIQDILNVNDRGLSLLVGRALEEQGLFHHVNYDHKLRDMEVELYQFHFLHDDDSYSTCTLPINSSPTTTTVPSNKLLSLKKHHKRFVPSLYETLPINSVFTPLTDCYSPTCTRKNPCYSFTCPRKKIHKKKNRPVSTFTPDQEMRSLWRHSVPLDIVMSTDYMEQKRQECIYELIYTEEDFARDMRYVNEFWVNPLKHSDIIPIERRDDFITEVFWNLSEIESISTALAKELISRQDKNTVIPCIGDILLRHVEGFDPFIDYGAHQVFGKHKYELEKKKNYKFLQFVKSVEKNPESRRLELNGYLTKPTSRLGRYNLLLCAIHELTPPDHQDFEDIPKVIDKITDYLVLLNKRAGLSDNAFHLQQISSRLLDFKGHDLELLEPKRQLLIRGKMKLTVQHKHHNSSPVVDTTSTDVQLFLFDHYLLFCKIKFQNGIEYYKLYQKPISLDHLSAFIPDTVIIPSTKSNIYNKLSSNHHNTTSDQSNVLITFQDLQTLTQSITLIAPNEYTRKLWIDKIEEQQQNKSLTAGKLTQ